MYNELSFGSTKLTDWANEPSLSVFTCDLDAAKPQHDEQVAKIQKWTNLLKVSGSEKPNKVKGRSSIQPKLVRRQAEWRYSALSEPLASSNKLFKISPVSYEDEPAARQNELVLNWQFRTKINKIKFIDDFVQSTVDEGTSIIRLGWKRITKTVKVDVPTWEHYPITQPQDLQVFQQLIAMAQEGAAIDDPAAQASLQYFQETGQATIAKQVGTKKVDSEVIVENAPILEMVNPANFYVDPSCCGDLSKALFVAVSFETNKAELLADGRYKNLDKVNWESNVPITQTEHATTTPMEFNFKDIARKKVVAYEYYGYYDIHGDGEVYPILATWIGDTLIRLQENPMPDGKFPFVVVPYSPVKRELFGEPDAEILEDNQKILGAVTRGMVDLLGRSANGQQGFAKGLLDPLNKRKFESGLDYEFNPNMSPVSGVIEHRYPEIPQSAAFMLSMQNQEAEALTGVKSFSGGLSGTAFGDVAAGVRGMLDAASKREMAILRRLAKGLTEIGTKIISMNALFLSDIEVIRVTNEEYVTVNREDLAGNFDLEVDISTAEVDDTKAKDLGFMLQTLGNNMDPSITTTLLAEIAQLKRMPTLAHTLRNWQPPQDPTAEQVKQLEIQKLQLELAKLQSEVDLNNARAKKEFSTASTVEYGLMSDMDGSKHAKAIEQQQAQAKANQDLEITKAIIKPRKEGETPPNIEGGVGYKQLNNLNQTLNR